MSKVKVYVVLELQANCIFEFRCMYANKRQAADAIKYFYETRSQARYFINEQYRWTESHDKGFWCEVGYEVKRDGTAKRIGKIIHLW